MLQKPFFNLENYSGFIVRYFSKCPGMLSLFRHSNEEGHAVIHCEDYDGKKEDFFVPEHRVVVRRCDSSEVDYVFTKVCSVFGSEPNYWLVICPVRRIGCLFPINVFDDKGDDIDDVVNIKEKVLCKA